MHALWRTHIPWVSDRRMIVLIVAICWITSGCESPKIDPQTRSNSGPPEPIYADVDAESDTNSEKIERQAPSRPDAKTSPNKTQIKLNKLKPQDDAGAADGGTFGDLILTPLRTYSKVKVRINDIQIKSQLNTFRAKNGGNPKDFSEYKKEILDPVGIMLPELPSGDSYVYLPERGREGEVVIASPR